MRPVVLIDTHSLLFRAHFALPVLSTQEGEPTAALYGFCALLIKVLREHHARGLSFAFDSPARTFRRERYEDYKANRARAPIVVLHQLRRLEKLLCDLELPSFDSPGHEADDVLATLALRLTDQTQHVLIVSGDRDLLQLCGAGISVLFVGARGKGHVRYDSATVTQRFGVLPAQLPSLIALVGDATDNLPGVPHIGPKIAASLVRRYGNVASILANLEHIRPGRVQDGLQRHREQILLNEQLATLSSDVPLGDGPLYAKITKPLLSKLHEIFETLEFKSLLGRLEQVATADEDTEPS